MHEPPTDLCYISGSTEDRQYLLLNVDMHLFAVISGLGGFGRESGGGSLLARCGPGYSVSLGRQLQAPPSSGLILSCEVVQ